MSARLDQFLKLIALDPADPLLRFGAGKELLDAGRAGEAAEHLRECLRLKPDYSAAYRFLGQALDQAGRPDEATEAYRSGLLVAEANGDLQTAKEMRVFLKRLEGPAGG